MNITLPTENLKTKDFLIRDGILYLRYGQSFQNTMYALTYFMKGRHFCYYCKKSFPRTEITMDHMYPRSTGGPTIPQNLIPACKHCNNQKSDLTLEQYKHFLSIDSKSQRHSYMTKMRTLKEGYRTIGMFEFPNTWITPVRVSNIHTSIDFANISEDKYQKTKAYYERNHSFQHPIILDRNLYSLDGFYVLFVAKSCDISVVPAIVLDNVEIHAAKKN